MIIFAKYFRITKVDQDFQGDVCLDIICSSNSWFVKEDKKLSLSTLHVSKFTTNNK